MATRKRPASALLGEPPVRAVAVDGAARAGRLGEPREQRRRRGVGEHEGVDLDRDIVEADRDIVEAADQEQARVLDAGAGVPRRSARACRIARVSCGSPESIMMASRSRPARTIRPPGQRIRRASATARSGSWSTWKTVSAR